MSSSASAGTAAAVAAWAAACHAAPGQPNESTENTSHSASRSSVSTNSDENDPISNRPVHARRSDQGWARMRRASSAIGISSHEAINNPNSSACSHGANPSDGSSRQPT